MAPARACRRPVPIASTARTRKTLAKLRTSRCPCRHRIGLRTATRNSTKRSKSSRPRSKANPRRKLRRNNAYDEPIASLRYWQDGDMWIGYLEEYPDYLTQGNSLDELRENLRDINADLASGAIPLIA